MSKSWITTAAIIVLLVLVLIYVIPKLIKLFIILGVLAVAGYYIYDFINKK